MLGDIKRRLAAATPGPWEHEEEGNMGCGEVFTANPDLYGGNIAAPSGDLYPRSGYSPKDDMVFIANAPTDIARLVAALEAVQKLAEEWRYKGEFGWGAWQEGYGPDPEGYVLDHASTDILNAINEALGEQ